MSSSFHTAFELGLALDHSTIDEREFEEKLVADELR